MSKNSVKAVSFKKEVQILWLHNLQIITARKRSCGNVMFLHLSVILFTGGSLCPGGGVFVQGVSVTKTLPPVRWKSGRYASYWNAFLSKVNLLEKCFRVKLSTVLRLLSHDVSTTEPRHPRSRVKDGLPHCRAHVWSPKLSTRSFHFWRVWGGGGAKLALPS